MRQPKESPTKAKTELQANLLMVFPLAACADLCSLAPPVAARRESDWVRFARPEYGVAPGQAAVAYDGTRLLGGGWIAETSSAADADATDAVTA